jgi:plasmid stabilization system protein ParE
MSYAPELSELAAADLEDAINWYKRLRPGLEADFALCVEESLARIVDNPESFPIVMASARRALVRRFPYGVIYRVYHRRIEVEAVFHVRRDPTRWQGRLAPA